MCRRRENWCSRRAPASASVAAANVAVGLAKLGRRAAVVGRVGSDFFGKYVADALSDAGVDCRYLSATSEEATSCSMIVNVRGHDRRFIHARGANRLLTGKEISADILRQTRIVYVGGYCLSDQPAPENVAALFRTARECGVRTVLDVVIPERKNYWSFLTPVLPWTDVFLPNNDEAQIITGESDPVVQARRFRESGATTVVITCGGQGRPSSPVSLEPSGPAASQSNSSTALAAATPSPPATFTACCKTPTSPTASAWAARSEPAASGQREPRPACSPRKS